MDEPYPAMKSAHPTPLPTNTGDKQPLWQALAKQVGSLAGKRVLVLHAGDGWFCRQAINDGAIAVLGVDHDEQAISAARDVASSDRLRYRIMPDTDWHMLTGPYDVIVGTFDLSHDDLNNLTGEVSGLLRAGGHLLTAVTTPLTQAQAAKGIQLKQLVTSELSIDELYQVSDQRLTSTTQLHFILSSLNRNAMPAKKKPHKARH